MASRRHEPFGRRAVGVMVVTMCLVPGLARSADDPRDAAFLAPVLQRALETARTHVEVPWRNPATGNSGDIVVERTFYREPGTPCRAYVRTLEPAAGVAQVTKGTGCRSSTGLWLVEEEAATAAAPAPRGITTPGTPPRTTAPPAREDRPSVAEAGPTCPDTVLVPMPAARPPALAYTLPSRAEL